MKSQIKFPIKPLIKPLVNSFAFATFCLIAMVSPTNAQQVSKMFEDADHDFGTVAKAATTEHRFYFTNPFPTPIHVKSVRTSCGCTTPSIVTENVEPGETGCILAVFNTKTHAGARAATVTVTFDKPTFTEVQLHVKGYIRTDVVFKPGEAMFGKVPQGKARTQEILLEYAGKPDWQITHAQCNEPYLQVAVQETSRQSGRINYNLVATLDESAPAGPLQTEVLLHTNDRNVKTVSLRVTADVEAQLSISPNMLSLGEIPTEILPKQVVVLRSKSPFKILGMESTLFELDATKLNSDSKSLHALPLVLKLKDGQYTDAEYRDSIRLLTDIKEQPSVELGVIFRVKGGKPETAKTADTADNGSNKK